MERIAEKMNFLWAAAVTLLSAAFGAYWYLFAVFMILNLVDYATGIIKAKYTSTENSNKGLKGILKKLGYWIVICISFFIATAFGNLGEQIGLDLGFTAFIGWYVLGTFIINEIRSVLENLITIGVEVPAWLVKGLEVANDKINNATGGGTDTGAERK